jgi:hypothetical protein
MDLTGRLVHFWLSPSGREALGEVISGTDFETLVVEENALGLWIQVLDVEHVSRDVILLKWEYFAAASLEYQPEILYEKPPARFRTPDKS